MQTPEHDAAEAVREMLRHLLKHLDTLDDQLKATTGSDPGALYPWAVAASRRVMEGFHAFGIEEELRHGRFMTPDITTRITARPSVLSPPSFASWHWRSTRRGGYRVRTPAA